MKVKILFLLMLSIFCTSLSYSQSLIFDNSFATNGIWVGQNDGEITDITEQNDGKIVSAGYSIDSTVSIGKSRWHVARHQTNGNEDLNFGTNGFIQTTVGNFQDFVDDVAIQNDDKIIAVGSYQDYLFGPFHTGICRYLPNGQLDSSFGGTGIIRLSLGQEDGMVAVKIQSDGKIVLGGNIFNGSTANFSLTRLKSNGTIDSSFGTNGLVITNFNDPSVIHDIELLSDGNILACGYEGTWGFGIGSNTQFAIAKYNSLGVLDNSFGSGGSLLLNINQSLDVATEIDVLSNGSILLSGYSQNCLAIVQLLPNGSLDNTFAQNGILARYGILDTLCDPIVTSTNILSDGKILVSGIKSINPFDAGFNIMRFHSNGSKDSTFGTNGSFESNISLDADYVQQAMLTANGKYLCAGSSGSKNLLVRYTFSAPTSIRSYDNIQSASIYPNPTTDKVHLSFQLKERTNVSIDVLNTTGQVVKSIYENENYGSGKHDLELDLSALASGKYFVLLKTNTGISSHKVILK